MRFEPSKQAAKENIGISSKVGISATKYRDLPDGDFTSGAEPMKKEWQF